MIGVIQSVLVRTLENAGVEDLCNRLYGLYRARARAVSESYGDTLTAETKTCSRWCGTDSACAFDVVWMDSGRTLSGDRSAVSERSMVQS